jgi:hypothetical protein
MIDGLSQVDVKCSRGLEVHGLRRSARAVQHLALIVLAIAGNREQVDARDLQERADLRQDVERADVPQIPERADTRQRERAAEAQRVEGQAVLALADAAMEGRRGAGPTDFRVRWRNAFLKAQQGTFVPFTLVIESPAALPDSALVYVRAVPRSIPSAHAPSRMDAAGRLDRKLGRAPADRKAQRLEVEYPVDAIFPVDLKPDESHVARVSRGFSIAPGDYDVYVVVRERAILTGPRSASRASVLMQPLTVPDFWDGELTTSSVILADRLTVLTEPISADQLVERPYVIGQNEITPAVDERFRRTEELVVVFLVYNPTVTSEKHFDVQVEYHFFQHVVGGSKVEDAAGSHPPARDGERYFNHTDPQRFNPAIMGAQFDPGAGQPVLAGQGIPLAGFDRGDYRLAIKVTDLLSGKSVIRDVSFTVS